MSAAPLRNFVLAATLLGALAAPRHGHEGLHAELRRADERIREGEDDAALHLHRADLHRRHGDPVASRVDLERAGELDAGCRGLDLGWARWFLDQGRPEQARLQVDRHLVRFSDDVEARIFRAELHEARGRLADAERDLHVAVAHEVPPSADRYVARARVAAGQGSEHVERALAGLDAGVERMGPLASLLIPAIELEVGRGAHDAALARIERAAARSKRKEAWLERRGDVLARAGRADEARTAWRAALDAIAELPARPRNTRAVLDLEGRLRARLEHVDPGTHE